MSELEMLEIRLEMEALITQREGLIAYNKHHQDGYDELCFVPIDNALCALARRCRDAFGSKEGK